METAKLKEYLIQLQKDELLFSEGEPAAGLFIIKSGQIMVFVTKGTEVIPLAYLGPGEIIGELSFFDRLPRSANLVALDATDLISIPVAQNLRYFPPWLMQVAQSMTGQIRKVDSIIQVKGLKRQKNNAIKTLPLQEQGKFFKLLKKYKEQQA